MYMARWLNVVIFFGGLAALIAAGVLLLLHQKSGFSGQVCIAVGHSESTAVREGTGATGTAKLGGRDLALGVGPDDVVFQNAATASRFLDPTRRYDFTALPFALTLKNINIVKDVEPLHDLKTKIEGKENVRTLSAGDNIVIDNAPFEVVGFQKWSGLLQTSPGKPMAAVSLRKKDGAWEIVFLDNDKWHIDGKTFGIHFAFCDSEADAQKGLPGIESARWATVDRTSLNWFETFDAGTGAKLADGTEITLQQVDEQHDVDGEKTAAIEVVIDEGGRIRRAWIPANRDDTGELVRFEYPAKLPFVLVLNAWTDGAALAAAYKDGTEAANKPLAAGDVLAAPGYPCEVRLDQVLREAAPVQQKDSPLYAAVLKGKQGEVRLRQGEAVHAGDAMVEYVRTANPPEVVYQLSVEKPGGKTGQFALKHDRPVTIGQWRIEQDGGSPDPLRIAVLRATFKPDSNMIRTLLGLGFAALVWVFLMGRGKPAS
jgi:hypothetical protein